MGKPHVADDDSWDDEEQPQFERVRKQTGKQLTVKDARKQESKEFGRAVKKYFKQRRRIEGEGKP
ncbi:MAG: hypothetical protein U0074_10605 [Kouleothrix sp.]|jgi:hypothetical protein